MLRSRTRAYIIVSLFFIFSALFVWPKRSKACTVQRTTASCDYYEEAREYGCEKPQSTLTCYAPTPDPSQCTPGETKTTSGLTNPFYTDCEIDNDTDDGDGKSCEPKSSLGVNQPVRDACNCTYTCPAETSPSPGDTSPPGRVQRPWVEAARNARQLEVAGFACQAP